MNPHLPHDRRVLRLLSTMGGTVVWGLMLLGFYLCVHVPLQQRHDTRQAQIETLEVLLRDHAKVHGVHRRLTRKLEDLNGQIETIRRRVPKTPMEATFLSTATTIAEEESIAIEDFRRESASEYEDYSEVNVVIQGTGSYASICRFLDRVSKLERLSTVRQMSLKSASSHAGYPFEVTYALQFRMQPNSEASNVASGGSVL